MSMEYGLVGRSLEHSFSPELHGLFADYKYDLIELEPEELKDFFAEKRFKGVNVTVPYKKTVLKYIDEISPEAKEIGAVNTVVNKDGRLFGYNTDFFGLCRLVEISGIKLEHKSVLVLGTGGTSRTAEAVCRGFGAESVLKVSRTPENEEISYAEAKSRTETEIIINTTPVGMFPHSEETPLDISDFPKLCGVIDVIYNPLRTGLVLDAKKQGIPSVGGLYMLAAQAAKSAELFCGEKISDCKIESAYKALLHQKENIVLIGMPTSGKSTVGRILAKKLGKSFFDSDELTAAMKGKSIGGIFESEGEAAFRRAEKTALELLSKQRGTVIATGGGAVLDENNMTVLRKNGKLYHIDRPTELLSADECHPLSKTREELLKLFEVRSPLYKLYRDVRINGAQTPEAVADEIAEDFLK